MYAHLQVLLQHTFSVDTTYFGQYSRNSCPDDQTRLLGTLRHVLSGFKRPRFTSAKYFIGLIHDVVGKRANRLKKADMVRDQVAGSILALTIMSAPSQTLYIKNLNDRVNKDELKSQLYALFLPYGQILDVIALKTAKMRGQAFVVFADLVAATTALRAWHGQAFYDKPLVRLLTF